MKKRLRFKNMRYTKHLIGCLSIVLLIVYLLFSATYLFYFSHAQTNALEKEYSQQLQTACERMALAFNECSQLADTLCGDSLMLEYLTVKPENIADLIGYRYRLKEAKTHLTTSFPGLDFCLYALDESVFPLEYVYPASQLPASILEYAQRVDMPQMALDKENARVRLYWPCDILEGVRLKRIAVVEVSLPISRLKGILEKMTNLSVSAVAFCVGNGQQNESFFLTEKQSFDHLLTLTGKIYATFNISASRIEGINSKIKTPRRKGYGYPDDDYFFLKLFDVSRKPSRTSDGAGAKRCTAVPGASRPAVFSSKKVSRAFHRTGDPFLTKGFCQPVDCLFHIFSLGSQIHPEETVSLFAELKPAAQAQTGLPNQLFAEGLLIQLEGAEVQPCQIGSL